MFDLIALAQDCAPEIPQTLILALAEQESSNNPFAIGHPSISSDNQPTNKTEATAIADSLAANNERYDAGLMQISSANFKWLGLDNQTVMDPCLNLAAAQKVIIEGLNIEGKDASTVFNTISRYNTGNANLGYKNGYVSRVISKVVKSSSSSKHSHATDWNNVGNTQGLFSLSIAQKHDTNHNILISSEKIETNNDETIASNQIQKLGTEHSGRSGSVALINPDS